MRRPEERRARTLRSELPLPRQRQAHEGGCSDSCYKGSRRPGAAALEPIFQEMLRSLYKHLGFESEAGFKDSREWQASKDEHLDDTFHGGYFARWFVVSPDDHTFRQQRTRDHARSRRKHRKKFWSDIPSG